MFYLLCQGTHLYWKFILLNNNFIKRFSTIWGIPVFTTSGMNSAFRDKTSEHRFLTCLAGDYFQLGIFVTKLLGIDIWSIKWYQHTYLNISKSFNWISNTLNIIQRGKPMAPCDFFIHWSCWLLLLLPEPGVEHDGGSYQQQHHPLLTGYQYQQELIKIHEIGKIFRFPSLETRILLVNFGEKWQTYSDDVLNFRTSLLNLLEKASKHSRVLIMCSPRKILDEFLKNIRKALEIA